MGMEARTQFLKTIVRSLNIDELIALFFIAFVLLGAGLANINFFLNGTVQAHLILLNTLRIICTAVLTFQFFWLIGSAPHSKVFRHIRDFAPFLFILAKFLNLHDAIALVNPRDVHATLAMMDQSIFGIQPVVWAEQFYHPRLTDWFSLAYLNYYLITLIFLLLLYRENRMQAFRSVMVTMMVAYYIGFLGYILFPASSPYVVSPELFHVDIWQDTSVTSWLVQFIVELSPERVRDAFPSLHNAITLLTMIFAWRYLRIYFWIQLPLALSLVLATVYLRYHFVVDIFAGGLVVSMAFYLTPRLEQWWQHYLSTNSKPLETQMELKQ